MDEHTYVDGVVHSLIFQNPENGYTVLRLISEEGELITVVGCIPGAAPGEHMALSGTWEQHSQHGRQLKAEEIERRLPEEEAEIESYLASGICKGVGPATARAIVQRFGRDTLEVLEREPEKLTALKGITQQRAQEISKGFCRHLGLRRLMAFLAQYKLPPVLAMRLHRRYGDAALEMISRNPYLLTEDGMGIPFSVADSIAMGMGIEEASDSRLQAAVTFELGHNERNGHVFLPRDKLIDATTQLLDIGHEWVEPALNQLIESGKIVQEKVARTQGCYLRRLWEDETDACRRLRELLVVQTDCSDKAEAAVEAIEREQGITYAPQQRLAVEKAARCGVLILTGGPGTGKTTAVRGIVALLRRMGLEIVLTAPTGRAAQRMSELTNMDAQTIHRLLGMNRDEANGRLSFCKSEKEPLEADAVVVDEMSMVDLPLFAALLRALRPGTRLILVGDADQLPSVGAGSVFSDLIRSERIETVCLKEVFRQAEQSAIIRNAHAVNEGLPLSLRNDQKDFFFLCRRDAERLAATVIELCQIRLPEKMGIPAEQIQVLCPTRKGVWGTVELNRRLQEALNPKTGAKRELNFGERLFREGDRIMQIKNDYDLIWERADGSVGSGIFNGDMGRVVQVDPSGEYLTAQFEDRIANYGLDQLNELDLAYAVTVHKAQGSEFRAVVLALGRCAPSLMVRGVLYTALTRAQELEILVGDDAAIREMAANDRRTRRYSGLRWRLAHAEEK